MKQTNEQALATFGRAALIPGLQHAIDVLQAEIDNLRAQVAGIQVQAGGEEPADDWGERETGSGRLSLAGLKRGSPEFRLVDAENKKRTRDARWGKLGASPAGRPGWGNLNAEERSVEMKRRKAVAASNAKSAGASRAWGNLTPEERSAEMKRRQKLAHYRKRWATKSAAKKKAWVAAMQAGKAAKQQQQTNGVAQ